MNLPVQKHLDWIQTRIDQSNPIERIGYVCEVAGLIIESKGPEASLGDIVNVYSKRSDFFVEAEVVGFRDNRVLLMPLGDIRDIHSGCQVVASSRGAPIPCGDGLIGRVVDGFGRPIDGFGKLRCEYVNGLHRHAPNPMTRGRIEKAFETGVKAIDTFNPLGCGQRMGIFAGSGVGKSTLLGMIARGAEADINVIALVGERGRELREFIENDLGPEGLAKSVVVVSTSDQSAPLRMRAAFVATRIAEAFRDDGKSVLLLMDSVTRFAMAQREIGLAVGEPPASRGYTPSVFSILPRLLERSGMSDKGSITALYTVLVEGDDFNEPISDAVRGILDGHIILSRQLATANHFPAVDVLESVSRLIRAVLSPEELEAVSLARDLLALYRRNEDLITVGAYNKGSNARLDLAIDKHALLMQFLKQRFDQQFSRRESLDQLKKLIK
ncbi:MAG: EscN/YscN/HrcN family type III secretion system ATPase [Verrucomicrobia bacterium GWF2_51_19]|nr:MAG: EscN/YscN/HrcN family type III secretion system ATPase [Verrucomicrobia bacterium GWF2_51_19]HCJ12456.1 EscN/YscN/HrcN family type III secretion system ATPase [Opitutae bacterium]